MTTLYQLHRQQWANGCGSDQCTIASKVVLGRGVIPCDILFIGEAPGESEDSIGKPFCGPAGHLLDQIIARAMAEFEAVHGPLLPTTAFTNLVGCIPRQPDGDKATEPEPDQVNCCSNRLCQFASICRPTTVVLVGKLAAKYICGQNSLGCDWLPDDKFLEFVQLVHPAAILRAPLAQKDMMVRKTIVTLASAIKQIYGGQ